MTTILWADNSKPLQDNLLGKLRSEVSPEMILKYDSFRRWQDQQAFLLGKILVKKVLCQEGTFESWEKVKYNDFGRPFFDIEFDFNISHSGGIVVCAVSNEGRVGIDVEEIKSVNPSDFVSQFRTDELIKIQSAKDPEREFFRHWTFKEALVKAVGIGLNAKLKRIYISHSVFFEDTLWRASELTLLPGHVVHLVSDGKMDDIVIGRLDLFN